MLKSYIYNPLKKKLLQHLFLEWSYIYLLTIIEDVVQIWLDEKIITPNNIINSFKTTEISINLDG